jgi:hypothetical protein
MYELLCSSIKSATPVTGGKAYAAAASISNLTSVNTLWKMKIPKGQTCFILIYSVVSPNVTSYQRVALNLAGWWSFWGIMRGRSECSLFSFMSRNVLWWVLIRCKWVLSWHGYSITTSNFGMVSVPGLCIPFLAQTNTTWMFDLGFSVEPKRVVRHVMTRDVAKTPEIPCFWASRTPLLESRQAMGNIATKTMKGPRRYPPPSTLVNHPSITQTQASNPFPLPAQSSQHPLDVHSKLAGTIEGELSNSRNALWFRSKTSCPFKSTWSSHYSKEWEQISIQSLKFQCFG